MAIVHRTGYTNRTDIPVELCAFPGSPSPTEWHSQELKDRTSSSIQFVQALVPSKQYSPMIPGPGFPPRNSRPCGKIDFAIPVDLTGEGHISSTSSEPISLSLYVGHNVVPDFSTYYQKLKNLVQLNLAVKPDPLEPKDGCERMPWNHETADMDESDYDWVPWSPTRMMSVSYQGNTSISVVPMQRQGLHPQPTPVHYLSEEARQPAFVAPSDIADLRSMSPEERDLMAPLAQPYTKVFAKGEELRNRYFARGPGDMQQIYVGDTWVSKVVAESQRKMSNMEHSLVVQL